MLRETGSFVKPLPYVLFSTRLKIVGYVHKKFLCHPDLLLSSPPPYLRLTRDLVSNRGDLTFPPPPHFPRVHFPHPSFDSQWKVKTIFFLDREKFLVRISNLVARSSPRSTIFLNPTLNCFARILETWDRATSAFEFEQRSHHKGACDARALYRSGQHAKGGVSEKCSAKFGSQRCTKEGAPSIRLNPVDKGQKQRSESWEN